MAANEYFVGIDVGTSYVKVVIIDNNDNIIGWCVEPSGIDMQSSITSAFKKACTDTKIQKKEISHITATGYGRKNVTFNNSEKTEISCHAKGAHHYFPTAMTVIDIGGQDTEIIKIDGKGKILHFKMNRKCAAGTGVFLEEIAYKLNVPMNKMNTLASQSKKDIALGSFCTVFASTEILTRIKEGEKTEDMVKSAFESVVKRVIEMDPLEGTVMLTGGVIAYNDIIAKILMKYVGDDILIPEYPQLMGAFGAAVFSHESGKN